MKLLNFIIGLATKTSNQLNQIIFDHQFYDYELNPSLTVLGFVDFDDDNTIKSLTAKCSLSSDPLTGSVSFDMDFNLTLDISELLGNKAAQYIQSEIVKIQTLILMKLDEKELIATDFETEHINNWNQECLLLEHPDLKDEMNCTFVSYWAAINLQKSLLKWSEELTKL